MHQTLKAQFLAARSITTRYRQIHVLITGDELISK